MESDPQIMTNSILGKSKAPSQIINLTEILRACPVILEIFGLLIVIGIPLGCLMWSLKKLIVLRMVCIIVIVNNFFLLKKKEL